MSEYRGFPPVVNGESELLVLGSFPSVMSRAEGFYYGNPRNRFWRVVCSFFREGVPADPEGKREFLLRRKIALWDMVASCEIEGSRDESIGRETLNDADSLLSVAPIRAVFCNGALSFSLLKKGCPSLLPIARRMPSTSPRNAGGGDIASVWHAAMREVFPEIS